MKPKKPVCQSCALPLLRDFDMGTERDGAASRFYCRHCYSQGAFTQPRMTAEQMHEIVRVRMIQLKFPRLLAKLSANEVYKLKRWFVQRA